VTLTPHTPSSAKVKNIVELIPLLSLRTFVAYERVCNPHNKTITILNFHFKLLKPNDTHTHTHTHTHIYIYMSYRSANLQTLHFKYLFNKYTY